MKMMTIVMMKIMREANDGGYSNSKEAKAHLKMMSRMITMIKVEPDGCSNAKEGKSALQNMVNTCSLILTSLFFAKKVRKENLHEK